LLTRLSAAQLASKLAAKEVSAVEVAQAHLSRIEALDRVYGAFLEVCADEALDMARRAQELLDRGAGGPVCGVPVALKDILATKGIPTTCASRILEGYVPPYDATVVERLRQAGMVFLGKTNLDEFAMGSSTETSAYKVSRNPWDPERSPGGSSGGSAAAVCAEMAPLALGTDTGGSIRQPAALCGIVGFKPTYGRCSRYGLVAFASSLDQIGPFGRTVEDAALLAEAITGHDPKDSTSLRHPPVDASKVKLGTLKGARLALPKEMLGDGTHPGVRAAFDAAIETLRSEGAEVAQVSIPTIRLGVTTYYIIAPSEASSNLARYDGMRFGPRQEADGHIESVERTRAAGFGHEVKMRILIGTYALSSGYYEAYYMKASQVRAAMSREFEDVFQAHDFVLGPTCPVPAFKVGEMTKDPLSLKLLDSCVIPANMGGFPAISLPCGLADGLPVGLHLLGPVLSDERLLQAAYCIERAFDATWRPPIP
jgi:aspartyl-tRNA(Asn)/glutamyl-tRNA(Gln) amidotransferase subunit A